MLAHKAVHEAHVAAEVAAGHKAPSTPRVIPGVAYTHPEVAWVGYTEDQAKAEGIKVEKACSRGQPPAAPSPTAPTKASPS
jgi:dihydrolipoamide dehydrogenase